MRQLATVIVLVAVLGVTAAACLGDHARTEPRVTGVAAAPTTPVPWGSATAAASPDGVGKPTPSPTGVSIASLPACPAGALQVAAKWQGATGGAIVGGLTLENTAGFPCYLAGKPGISVFGESGQVIFASAPLDTGEPVFLSARVPELPEESANYAKAISRLSWSSRDDACGGKARELATKVVVELPRGLGFVEVPQMAGIRPCGGRVTVGTLEPTELKKPYSLRPSIAPHVTAPAQVRAGETFRYVVALENESDFGLVFGPLCPSYRQRLVANRLQRTQATVADGTMRLLNCDGLFRIARGETVEFEMLLEVPAMVAPGQYYLEFDLNDQSSSYVGSGGAKIEVIP